MKIPEWLNLSFIRRTDWALVFAAATEIPRWTIAFIAVNEPWWVGVPLGALLSWALREGWETYFKTKNRWMLAINSFALLAAIMVISPVLYNMIFADIHSITLSNFHITEVDPFLMVWSCVLAGVTFLPLIQISASRSYAQKVEVKKPEAKVEKPRKTSTAIQKVQQNQDSGDFYIVPGESREETVTRWVNAGFPITATKLAQLLNVSNATISKMKAKIEQ